MSNFTSTNSTNNSIYENSLYFENSETVIYIMALIISSLCILGNGLTIVVLVRRSPLLPQTTRILLSLTAADLLVGITMAWDFTYSRYLEDVCCIFINFLTSQLSHTAVVGSLSNTLLVGVDRYVAIFKPLTYNQILTSSRITMLQIVVWTVPILYTFTYYFWYSESHNHDVPSLYIYIINFGSYCLVGIVICYMYVRISLIAKWHSNRIRELPTVSKEIQESGPSKQPNNKTSNMLIYLMVAYIVAWTPSLLIFTVSLLADLSSRYTRILAEVSDYSVFIGYTSSLWNILIYIYNHKGMRKAYLNTVCCK